MSSFTNLRELREKHKYAHEKTLEIWKLFEESIEKNPISESYSITFEIESGKEELVKVLLKQKLNDINLEIVHRTSSDDQLVKLAFTIYF